MLIYFAINSLQKRGGYFEYSCDQLIHSLHVVNARYRIILLYPNKKFK